MDNTIFPLVENLIEQYNKKYKDNVSFRDIITYDISPYLKNPEINLFEEFATEKTFENLEPYKVSLDVINCLMQMDDYEVYFVSAGHPVTSAWRNNLLIKHFPNYDSNQLIMTRNKQMINVDYLIDDYYENLKGGKYKGLLFFQPWNKNYHFNNARLDKYCFKKSKIISVYNWMDIAEYFNLFDKSSCPWKFINE